MLDGLVDIFLPDLKYFDSRLGEKYSGVPKYFEYASEAIRTMFAMTGPARLGDDGLFKTRHDHPSSGSSLAMERQLPLPGLIHETFGDDVSLLQS